MAKSLDRQIAEAGALLEKPTRKAFFRAVDKILRNVSFPDLVAAITAGNIEQVLTIINFTSDHFDEVAGAIRTAFVAGGDIAIGQIPKRQRTPQGARANIVFGAIRPENELVWRTLFDGLVTEVSADTQIAIRKLASDAAVRGLHPNRVALDLVGRVNKTTGNREGGIIGLHSADADRIQGVRAALRDPTAVQSQARLKSYLGLKGRSKRYDSAVRAVIANGTKASADLVDDVAGGMRSASLLSRALRIGRTETLDAMGQGVIAGANQIAEAGLIDPNTSSKKWVAVGDNLTRNSHAALNGVALPLDGVFTSPLGGQMRQPRDRSLGASGADTINCRCRLRIVFDFLDNRNLQ